MPLLPIDLQTLFSQLNQVGKEQSVQKEAGPHAQALQGAQLVRRAEQRDNAVNETQRQEEGPEQAKTRLARAEGERRRRSGKERKDRDEKQSGRRAADGRTPPREAKRDVFKDPALGRNVDITS
jgi:hypothetical protein